MCAQYTLKTEAAILSGKYKIKVADDVKNINLRFLPHSFAPVVVAEKNTPKLTTMKFSLVPAWAKEPRVKFATYNARIESITEKPTWRTPFQSQHCLVPLTAFYESVHNGPEAGHIIELSEQSDQLLFAAGLFDFWKDPKGNQSFFSFAILTQAPSPFILAHGHDRTPVFLKGDFAFDWLTLVEKDESHIKATLLSQAYHPELKVSIDRPLKAGWEKRK